jgi:hypothetical protein
LSSAYHEKTPTAGMLFSKCLDNPGRLRDICSLSTAAERGNGE